MGAVSRQQAMARFALWAKTGQRTLPPDNIAVQGHCVGTVGRAYLGASSRYPTAADMAHACIKAGVVKSTGQFGDIVLFLNKSGKGDGHACLSLGGKSLMSSDRMITGRIGYCTTSQIWSNLRLVGFVDPHRVPGWPAIPADPKPTVHPSGPVRGVNTYAKGLVFKTKLAAGSRGPFVCEIQYHLRVPVTGVYDAKTLAAVKAVQKRRFPLLGKADGIAGPVTYRTITGHK